jgi:UDP-glucose 4-epimerase
MSNIEKYDCKIAKVSILEKSDLEKALLGSEYIFHLAAVGSVPRSIKQPEKAISVNTIGTFNVLEFARKTGISVLFSSSSSVYGLNQELPKKEKMWTQPLSPYAASKLGAEALVTSYNHSYAMANLVLRFFNVYGPKQRSDHDYAAVIPKWIRQGIQGKTIEIFGDGSATRDFTYVDIVVDIMIKALERKITHDTPINVATGNSIQLLELIDELKKSFGSLSIRHSKERVGDVKNSQNDPTLLNKIFPNLELVSFREGLSKTIEWNRENANF